MWRLGGLNDYFSWTNDNDRISGQHSCRVLDNGNYMVFDNGNYHNIQYSRALEFSVDTDNWLVTKEWEYRENPDFFTLSRGNIQVLPNGNILICWASNYLPKLTEVRLDGSKAYECNFVKQYPCYRSFRFPWKGKAAVPYLMVEHKQKFITLLFNKFGDQDVVQYNIYNGLEPHPDQIIATDSFKQP